LDLPEKLQNSSVGKIAVPLCFSRQQLPHA